MLKTRGESVLAWHFVRNDRRLKFDASHLTVEPGYVYACDGDKPLKMCHRGMHASLRVYDALQYATGSVLCRVRLSGEIIQGNDKLVARRREVLDMRDVSSEMRVWACWCVRNTKLTDGRTTWNLLTDERSRNAIETAERYEQGQAGDTELNAARDAARDAACAAWDADCAAASAAWNAARDADCAARDADCAAACAAWNAARDAAWAAAWATAWDAACAARDAAWAAACAARDADWAVAWAARDAAWDAAKAQQADELEKRMRNTGAVL